MVILVPIDAEEGSARVVELGHSLATAYSERLIVLHVMADEQYEEQKESREEYYLDKAAEDAALEAKEVVDEVLPSEADVQVRGRVGDIVEEVLAEASGTQARFLVIGGRKKSPVGKAVFGSVSQKILLKAEIPVVSCLYDV